MSDYEPIRHLYIHIPFCDGKCVYCGFYSERFSPALVDTYIGALACEFDRYLESAAMLEPLTIYLGGGTPSLLSPDQLAGLCDMIHARMDCSGLLEWTVEANPGTLTQSGIRVLLDAGVNRVSLGVQSFDDAVLQSIGRRHTADDAARAPAELRSAGLNNIGLDLIAALPGVNETTWHETLERAVGLEPEHISVYALSVEPGSRLRTLVQAGKLSLPREDAEIRALAAAECRLLPAGYERYEVSNYARPGYQCLHNLACWRGQDYLGFGPAAASRCGRRRWTNRPSLVAYINALAGGDAPSRRVESLPPAVDADERLAFAFRLREGIDLDAFVRTHGIPVSRWATALDRMECDGLISRQGTRRLPTDRGLHLADYIAAELLAP